ncbi:MAG: radical SAM protein, partial [Candidatus Helarchaeota archaeon]
MSELNVVRKDFKQVELKIALCYPNVYQAGIACYAIQLLYYLFNSFDNVQCERFYYTPKFPPISLESKQPLKSFDIVCFSLQYELDYMNLLEMINSAGIELYSERRKSPLVIAGGPCALENPLPISPFLDIFVLGDLEPIIDQLITALLVWKKDKKSLEPFQEIPGLYIPSIYEGESIQKLITPNLDDCFHPTSQLITDFSPFNRNLMVEVTRGCPRGCRFCLIGYQAVPMRSRSLRTLKEIIIEGTKASQVDKITLIGPSLSDYAHLEELCSFLIEQDLKFSLPSLRIDALSESFLEILKRSDIRTLSLAPEAGSDRLRTAIGKPIAQDHLISTLISCVEAKIKHLKLYFIISLPTETTQDILAINDLLKNAIDKYITPQQIHLSINPFISKPHTPFQWEPPFLLQNLQKIVKILEKQLKKLKIYNSHFLDPRWARIQSVLSRGSSELAPI